jgi:cyclophilin family peptidyl-prolyl cis-trans isomerase
MSREILQALIPSLVTFALAACREKVEERPAAPAAEPAAPAAKPAAPAAAAPAGATATDALASMREFIASKAIDKNAPNWKTLVPRPPRLTFDPARSYYWRLETSEGPIKIRLMPDIAPMHVSSTIYLTELGFYDGLLFHRVIPGFMAQGGDPLGTGTGGPGYKYAGEFSPKARHSKPGLLSMANAGPNTDGSQFFLTFVPTPHLDDKHTIFGEVVEGLDALKRLEAAGSPSGKTSKPLSIEKATILIE